MRVDYNFSFQDINCFPLRRCHLIEYCRFSEFLAFYFGFTLKLINFIYNEELEEISFQFIYSYDMLEIPGKRTTCCEM